MKKQLSIAEIGVYPPPYGGISVHIERLCDTLEQRGIDYCIYDENGHKDSKRKNVVPIESAEAWSRRYIFQENEDVIHNHFLRWQVRFILSLLRLKGKRVVHTVHSLRNDGKKLHVIQRVLIRITGLLSHHFVAVSEEVRDSLLKLGIPDRKISVIPAFIAPVVEGELSIPAAAQQFIDKHQKLIVANGGIGNIYQGVDLYGADLCVDAFIALAKRYPDAGFLYAITHIVDQQALKTLKTKLVTHQLQDRFLFVQDKMPLYPLIQQASLFVRPSASDGDAISIREALYVGTPVVTSDVVSRPDGVRLFSNRNVDAFEQACIAELEQPRDLSAYRVQQEQYVERLLDVLK